MRMMTCALAVLCAVSLGAAQGDGPQVVNASFEQDRFTKYPGHAANNGGISGWTYTGNVGVNPFWETRGERERPRAPFVDNGQIPHGRQVALMQNECTLRQSVAGFRAGRRYRVTYHENARQYRQAKMDPRLRVTLGGEVVVSEHGIQPVEPANSRSLPYDFVESAVFEAPRDGAFELAFVTTVGGGVTVLIDQVSIEKVE